MRNRVRWGCVLWSLSACLAPTEIELDISTNVDCATVSGTHIDIGQAGVDGSVAQLETQQCQGNEIGTLVITPGGASDPIVAIEVAAAVKTTPDLCVPPYFIDAGPGVGCIVARRAIHYTSHTPLHLPIALDSDCLNIPCLADQTCEHGKCVSSMVDPNTCASDAGCQLGDAGVADAGAATPVQLAVGDSHACALMSDGTVRCWGDNTSGQLGTTSVQNQSAAAVEVETINDATSISAGSQTTCVVRSTGEVWCWGNDAYGAVDAIERDGSAPNVATPTGPIVTGAIAVSVGATFSCALMPTGDAGVPPPVCWGARPSSTMTFGPELSDIGGIPFAATELVCGFSACNETNGTGLAIFGEDTADQLDLNTNTGMITENTFIGYSPLPVTGVAMGTSFGCVSAGTTGIVMCWGDNALGELGQTATGPASLALTVSGLSNVTGLTASSMHACAVSGGIVSCWGDNLNGQLGLGTMTPMQLGPQPIPMLTGVDEVVTGKLGTCVRQGATVTCWGSGYLLGDGSNNTGVQSSPGLPVKL